MYVFNPRGNLCWLFSGVPCHERADKKMNKPVLCAVFSVVVLGVHVVIASFMLEEQHKNSSAMQLVGRVICTPGYRPGSLRSPGEGRSQLCLAKLFAVPVAPGEEHLSLPV